MIALERDGRYDDAVNTVQGWSQDGRRDISRDGLLYQQIGMVYITKAYKKQDSREDSVHQAQLNFEKALSLHNQEPSEGLGTDLFEIGGGYEALGNLPITEKCECYEKARQLFERQLPLIQSGTYTVSGRTFSPKPLQVDVQKHLNAVRQKLSSSGRAANGKQ